MSKIIKALQTSKLKKRAAEKPSRSNDSQVQPPKYPLFLRVGIFSQRQCRALLARILKLLLNGDLPESRVREARWLVQSAIEINRELSLRARLDAVCSFLKLAPQVDDAEDIPLDDEGVTEDG